MLLVSLLVNSRLLVAKFGGSQKLYTDFNCTGVGVGVGVSIPCVAQGSTVLLLLTSWNRNSKTRVVSLLWNIIFFFNKVSEDLFGKSNWKDVNRVQTPFLLLRFSKQVLQILFNFSYQAFPRTAAAETSTGLRKIK